MTEREPAAEHAARDRLVVEALRAGRRRERMRLAAIVAAVFVVTGGVVLALVLAVPDGDADGDKMSGNVAETDAGASLTEVAEFDDLSSTHVTTPVEYDQSPPVGGPHNPIWLNCGVYPDPIPNENVVHSMEHGAIWITYVPTLEASQIAALEAITPSTFAVLSPYPEQDSPVAISAWGRQMKTDTVSDPRISAFIAQYRLGGVAPEPGASCDGASDGTLPLDGG